MIASPIRRLARLASLLVFAMAFGWAGLFAYRATDSVAALMQLAALCR
jgi:hypothetical protein